MIKDDDEQQEETLPLGNPTSLCHDSVRRAQQFVRRVTLQNRTSLEL